MANKPKGKSSGGARKTGKNDAQDAARRAAEAIPDALREAGRRAADLAQNPVARSLLAAGLVT
ncbi:hypothetical protein, partial [Sphingosinicella sp. YJ22]|uniref:hypothetical protein n=1 Tax=Sphingosinicella sp. YJ22 TaxID=1104780 RepID=UPI001408F915